MINFLVYVFAAIVTALCMTYGIDRVLPTSGNAHIAVFFCVFYLVQLVFGFAASRVVAGPVVVVKQ